MSGVAKCKRDLDFSGKCIIFVLMKRREPACLWFSPLFLRTKLIFRGFSTSKIEKYLSEIEFFLGVSGNFLEEVVRIMSDVARCKVKIHLFYWDAFLTFRVTTQVAR